MPLAVVEPLARRTRDNMYHILCIFWLASAHNYLNMPRTGAEDLSGNALANEKTWSFRVRG